jgi:hypothetical protein
LTTKQLQERALLLLSYSFLHEIFEQQDNKNLELKDMSEADLMFKQIYKKLCRIKKSFTNNETRDFLLKNVPDNILKRCDMALVSILILAWFKRFNLTKEIIINDDVEKLAKLITEELKNENENEIIVNSIEYANSLVCCIYPKKKGVIEFRKMLNKFPFNLI